MTDYWAGARTNYFEVQDLAAFHHAIDALHRRLGHEAAKIVDHPGKNGTICLLDETGRGWGWISDGVAPYEDLAGFVGPHLADGWVAEFREVGAEKLAYVGGSTVAVNNQGERVTVDLDDIYGRAASLGSNFTTAAG